MEDYFLRTHEIPKPKVFGLLGRGATVEEAEKDALTQLHTDFPEVTTWTTLYGPQEVGYLNSTLTQVERDERAKNPCLVGLKWTGQMTDNS